MLSIENVSKRYGQKVAIQGISFEVPAQSAFGLLGPNGAGKTTLIRIINQIIAADEGSIRLNGEPIGPEHIGQIGYMPEERGLYKKMKVGEQMLYLAQLKGLSKAEAIERSKAWFRRLEITTWWDKKVESLSKGMQQKIQFVATVIHNPKLIILDEPFSGFDPVNAVIIKDEILRLREEGATIMLSTHRMESVEELCDHLAMIHQSQKVLDGQIGEIKEKYKEGIYEAELKGFDAANGNQLEPFCEELEVEPVNDLQDVCRLRMRLKPGTHSNTLLQNMIGLAEVKSFREVLPSINEIFIKLVNE